MEIVTSTGRRPTLAAIYSLTFLSTGMMLVSPALASIAAAFPGHPYSMVLLVYTLPSLSAVPFALLSGAIVGRRLHYRSALTVSIMLYVVAGTLPVFLNSLEAVLVCRAFFGAAVGLIGPHGNALIIRCFSERDRRRYIGYTLAFVGLSGVTFQTVGGYLCSFGWRYTFLAHLIALIPLALVAAGMRDPPSAQHQEGAPPPSARCSVLPPRSSAPIFVIIVVTYMVSQSKSLTMSSIVASEGLGDSTTSGFILGFGVMGAILGAILFPRFLASVRDHRTTILMLCLTGTSALTLVNHVPVIAGAYFLGVIAFLINHNMLLLIAAEKVPTEDAGTVTAFSQCAEKFGVFLATWYVSATMGAARLMTGETVYKAPIAVSVAIYFLIGVVSAVAKGYKKQKKAEVRHSGEDILEF